MTLNKLAFSLLGALALAAPSFAGTAPSAKCSKCVAPVVAPEELLGFTLAVGYDSTYVFRGVDFGDNWLSTSLDYTTGLADGIRLDLGAEYGHVTDAGFLGTGDVSFDRLQLSAQVVADLGGAEVGLGYRYYLNEGELGDILDDTNEISLSLASKVSIFNVGVGANYDVDGEGWYFEAAVNTEIVLCDRISVVPGVNIGYGVDYTYQLNGANAAGFGVDGFTAVGGSLAFPIKLSKTATLTPYVGYNLPIDALDDLGEEEQLFGGVSLSVKF